MEKFKVSTSEKRIDKYISEVTEYSRSTITKMLQNELILVNDKPCKPSYQVKENDEITILQDYQEETHLKPTKMDLNIVYEDDDILVINKPTGLVVHPGSGNKENTLANGLLYYTEDLSNTNGEERPGIVHRLDKDTSGLMLVAKSNKAHAKLTEDFQVHAIKREYIALLCGVFPHKKAKIDAPIGRDTKNRKKMEVTAINSKSAITHLEVLKHYTKNTLVRLQLETGRTHQIRVHMKYIGYPVFNDPVYGKQIIDSVGQFLHSRTIDFSHPITGELMHFECPLPTYFEEYLKTLEELN